MCVKFAGLRLGLALLMLAGCKSNPPISSNLQSESSQSPGPGRTDIRTWLQRPEALAPISVRLAPRASMLTIRTAGDWAAIQAAAPRIGAYPDPHDGIIVGIICESGTPVDGGWPIKLRSMVRNNGRVRLAVDLLPNSYLPDGATAMELFVLPDIREVDGVELNQVLYERSGP